MGRRIVGLIPTYRRAPFKDIIKNPLYLAGYSWFIQRNAGPLIIVHDGKIEDYTRKVVKELKNFGEVIFKVKKEHSGPSGARNFCLDILEKNFGQKVFMSWEDDCLFLSKRGLQTLYKLLVNSPHLLLIPSVHLRKIKWKVESNFWHKIVGSYVTGLQTKVDGITKYKNLGGIFIAKKNFVKEFRFPIVPWPNGWGEESLLALKIYQSGYSIGYTSEVVVIHLKFGRKKGVEGIIPNFNYKLPIDYQKILDLVETDIKITGCKVPPKEWKVYKVAGLGVIYYAKKGKEFSFNQFKKFFARLLTKKTEWSKQLKKIDFENAYKWYRKGIGRWRRKELEELFSTLYTTIVNYLKDLQK